MRFITACAGLLVFASAACAGPSASAPVSDHAAPERGPAQGVVERFQTGAGYSQAELEALSPPERDQLAVAAEALLAAEPATNSTVTRVEVALAHAWSPGAEAIFARLTGHTDPFIRLRAVEGLRARGLSRMALARGSLASNAPSPVLVSVVTAMGFAADAEPRAIAEACDAIAHDDDADWTCKLEIARAGDPSPLGRKMRGYARTADVGLVAERLQWLAGELRQRGPWRELADLVFSERRPAPPPRSSQFPLCGNALFEASLGRRPLGDAFVRWIAFGSGIELSFAPDRLDTFTAAQRAEVKRKVLAAR